MNTTKRVLAAAQLLLMFPAILFMSALVVRQLCRCNTNRRTPPSESSCDAARLWTLWVLLITLPFAVLVTGCVTLLRSWSDDAELPQAAQQTLAAIRADLTMQFVAAMPLTAGVVLAIVGMHMLAN